MTRNQLKYLAKRQLEGNVGVLFLASLISFFIILGAYVLMTVISVVLIFAAEEIGAIIAIVFVILASLAMWIIVHPAFNLGRIMLLQRICEDPNGHYGAGYIFNGFKHFWGAFKIQFASGWLTFVWSLVGVIPGTIILMALFGGIEGLILAPSYFSVFAYIPQIIKTYSYSQAIYTYAENPDMGAFASITRSKMMMRGRKFDYFVLLQLSFYPWMLLMPFTLGILGVWLIPYIQLTAINFYNNAKTVPGHPNYGFPSYGEVIPSYMMFKPYHDSYQQDLMGRSAPAPQPAYQPVYQQPMAQPEPIVEQPAYQQPMAQPEPIVEQPIVEQPKSVEETVELPREVADEATVALPREVADEETVVVPVEEKAAIEDDDATIAIFNKEPSVEEPSVEELEVEEPSVEEPESVEESPAEAENDEATVRIQRDVPDQE